MKSVSVFLFFAGAVTSVIATDYCSKSICDNSGTHIACRNNGKFLPGCPADATLVSFTSSMKQLLVDEHNEKRNYIAGGNDANHKPACRMATMQWDDELASIAAFNVRQCKMSHDQCRNTDAFKYSGQNIAWMGITGHIDHEERLKRTVQMWFDEVEHSRQSFIDKFPNGYSGPSIGHFTVMMADRNIRVGCAAAHYSESGSPFTEYLVACNYATTNMINFPIYASCSTAGADCTSGTNPDYPNLCSLSEVYEVNKWF